MKTLAIVFAVLCLVQISSAVTCSGQYYAPLVGTRCFKCPDYFSTCTDASTGVLQKQIVGFQSSGSTNTPYCPPGSTTYNKVANTCQTYCKMGCATCQIDYDFCLDCTNGFTWNTDYTCLPAVIGLEAASLALLTISFVFLIISCCLVNKARK